MELFRASVAQHQAGQLAAAEQGYRQILAQNSRHAQSLHLLGVVELQTGRLADAKQHIESAIAIGPAAATFYGNLGTVLLALKDHKQALVAYQKAVELDPKFVDGFYNLANCFRDLKRFAEAEDAFKNALRLNPQHSGSMNNFGTLLRERNRSDEACELLQRAVQANPQSAESHYNLGNAWRDLGDVKQAIAAFERANERAPKTPRVLAALGMANLLRGDLEAGWQGYEWRMQCEGGAISQECQPRWNGVDSLEGKRILLFAEQGLGDSIQFVQFARALKQRGAIVLLECQTVLCELLRTCDFIDEVIPRGTALPSFDVAAPLLSLPYLLKCHARESLQQASSYLRADADRQQQWAEKLSAVPGLKIGIAWQGAKDHLDDCRRSFPLKQFRTLARDGVTFVSLQKGYGDEQVEQHADLNIVEFAELDDGPHAFLDTAALMKSLDLVISSDTSVAHLAGALGVPNWVGLCAGPDWRWFAEGSDSSWYPQTRLFRQPTAGDWDSVFQEMARAIDELNGTSGQPASKQDGETNITIEISPGELFDKITILEIKSERITDSDKLANVCFELGALRQALSDSGINESDVELAAEIAELKKTNETLWDIEDDIRQCEAESDFAARFIELARAVYKTNDHRSAVKRQINERLGSLLIEEKSYSDYGSGNADA